MKSEFMLAFNEICQSRGLPRDIVLEALKVALISAYRRNTFSSANQEITAEIDQQTGEAVIFAEKEVVDATIDDRTEVTLTAAHAAGYADADMGDTVMIDSTPPNFGRIAAQTAKQVILQRVREAERDQLFEDFSAREGEIVNGTVQSVSGQHITIGLGRTEALLPKSQQVRSERYRPHDKIRVYVLEVRRTNRGPQIIVSRNHRNLLRRLLELEVPEIFNGQVDIKSIAREAGARSKVAVSALQPGVDPVGACVGMRGVRIQSIVRELNDEKIDVIEYNTDQQMFIAKALSPSRVANVFLEDSLGDGKTATVIVPDDQLSLAIGREGQNARLAAKLTGWRIDIKSLTEAARDSLKMLDHEAVSPKLGEDKEILKQVEMVLAKKDANRPITAEDNNILNRLVVGVEGAIIRQRAMEFESVKSYRSEVPEFAWKVPATMLELPTRVDNLLETHEIDSLGDILLYFEMGDQSLLEKEGFGDKSLEQLKEAVAAYMAVRSETLAAEETEAEGAEVEGEVETIAVEEVAADAELVVEDAPEADEELEIAEMPAAVKEADEVVEESPEEEADELDLEDLSRSLVSPAKKPDKPKKPTKQVVIVAAPEPQEEMDAPAPRRHSKGKELVFDEDAGEVVVRRKRKKGQKGWEEELDELDFDY